ncbi:OmpA family protein [Rahnella woolbedingensis]|uniref:OmpA family protein n=1 Tax=Rahnella woolbedingensis TaxID=1510574 RepID=A0A419N359_9GAMM|nr:OmpA family protein [Rahnella woolbedingensis]RJT37378.1 OmpA family protein [Rahnella woolbedingensis]
MRKSAAANAVFPVLVTMVALLWLLWVFLTLQPLLKAALTLVAVVVGVWVSIRRYRRQRPAMQKGDDSYFPAPEHTGPVLLVCGDGCDEMFVTGRRRVTSQGCYLQVGDASQLTPMADALLAYNPLMAGQLVVMFNCLPDLYRDEALLRAALKVLRHQVKQLTALTGYVVPVVLSCAFSGTDTPWIIIRGTTPVVCPDNEPALSLAQWQQQSNVTTTTPLLKAAFRFVHQVIIDEFARPDRLCAAVHPFAVTLRCGSALQDVDALWPQWLYRHSYLHAASSFNAREARWYFPDPVIPLLSPYSTPLQGGKTGRRVILILLVCAITALLLSVANNRDLIRRVGADLQRWSAIPMGNFIPKAQALNALKKDALLLERWQRQGEPHRYSLGLYPGERLWLNVQQAIDTYVPPPPPPAPKPAPTIIRLDSMSLFDSGKSELKIGSTKVLVNSLVGIKAKPGWLIVVSGHTDNTGSDSLNQTLSLKRAEAVRDWMRDTGDVPESCFAVQGYGASRPVATNDTAAGRALNRRVEISLVPQADACHVPGETKASSQDDGVTDN